MEPSDEELLGLMPQQLRDDLARPAPAPAPPAAGEVAGEPAAPEGREPTRDELWELWLRLNNELPDRPAAVAEFWEHAQIDARSRYSHQPAPPAEGEGLPSDQEIADVFSQGCRDFSCSYKPLFLGGARAILARWGRPAPAPAPATEGDVGELVAFLLWHASGLGHCGHGKRGRLLLTRAADLLAQRHPAPVLEEAANPWKDALIDALVCNFLLTTENESDPKKALHDLISWETRLAMDPSINPLMRPVPVSERLPRPEDCDGERNCWQWIPDISGHYPLGHWELQHRDWVSDPDGDATHWLPSTALPLPAAEVKP